MKKLHCLNCPTGCQLTVIGSGIDMVVDGNECSDGYEFARTELTNPTRTLTTTVRTKFPGIPVISVRTDGDIPKEKIMTAIRELSEVVIDQELECGDTVVEDVAETGVRVILTGYALTQLGAELENKNAELERRGSTGGGGSSVSASVNQGIGIVRNPDALDTIGMDAAGGFVGAAGEAVGVEGEQEEDEAAESGDASSGEEGRLKKQSRPHIKRR